MIDLLEVDIDALIRDRIVAAMREKGLRQAEVCRATRGTVKKAAFSAFLKGGEAGGSYSMSWDKYAAIERALGMKILPDAGSVAGIGPVPQFGDHPQEPLENSSGSVVHSKGSVTLIPVVDVRRVELPVDGGDMLGRIKRAAHAWIATPVSDPDAFAVELKAPQGRFEAGDRLIISPAVKPLNGNWVAIQVGTRLLLAEHLVLEDKTIARVSQGEFHKVFKLLGTAVGRYQSLI